MEDNFEIIFSKKHLYTIQNFITRKNLKTWYKNVGKGVWVFLGMPINDNKLIGIK